MYNSQLASGENWYDKCILSRFKTIPLKTMAGYGNSLMLTSVATVEIIVQLVKKGSAEIPV